MVLQSPSRPLINSKYQRILNLSLILNYSIIHVTFNTEFDTRWMSPVFSWLTCSNVANGTLQEPWCPWASTEVGFSLIHDSVWLWHWKREEAFEAHIHPSIEKLDEWIICGSAEFFSSNIIFEFLRSFFIAYGWWYFARSKHLFSCVKILFHQERRSFPWLLVMYNALIFILCGPFYGQFFLKTSKFWLTH